MGGFVLRWVDPRGPIDRSQRSTDMIHLDLQVLNCYISRLYHRPRGYFTALLGYFTALIGCITALVRVTKLRFSEVYLRIKVDS